MTYIVADPDTGAAAVIDPVLDYDHSDGSVDAGSADKVLGAASARGWKIIWALETHAHADHLSAAPYIKAKTGARIGIGEHITDVQRIFRPVFNATDLKTDGSDFDHLFKDGEVFSIGDLKAEVLHVPGIRRLMWPTRSAILSSSETRCSCRITARRAADFPGGDARQLYHSIRRLLSLPPDTRLFMCHDYKAPGRDEFRWETTVADQRRGNKHVHDGVTEEEFVAMRTARDAKLDAPRLLLPSIQVNIRAGRFPPAESNGVQYLMIPVKLKSGRRRPEVSRVDVA